jgi:hypothetical protein
MAYDRKKDFRDSSLKKVFEKTLGHATPVVIHKRDQKEFLDTFAESIKKMQHIKVIPKTQWGRGHDGPEMRFVLELNSSLINNFDFIIYFNDEGKLQIHKYYNGERFHIEKADNIIQLTLAIREAALIEAKHVEKLQGEAVKREKVKSLKRTAILAKIVELCNVAQVEHEIETGFNHKIRLYILLKQNYFMEIDIPYSDFQPILQNLNIAIQALKDLQEKGINVKVKSPNQMPYRMEWIKPKKIK